MPCATSSSFARRERSRAVWLLPHGRISGRPLRVSVVEVGRDPSHRVGRGTCSCRHLLRWNGAQMVIARWEGDKRITCFLRGYPDRTVASPFSGENILGKSRKQGCRQRGFFKGESVKGP